MRKIFTVKHLLMLALSACVCLASAQPSTPKREGERHMFVEVTDLNAANYATLTSSMQSEERMTIHTACVPAHVLMLALPASNTDNLETNLSTFREIVNASIGPMKVNLLAEYSEESFMARCKQFRGSGNP